MPITQSTVLPLEYGDFSIAYHKIGNANCISLSHGDVRGSVPIVRLHSSCLFGEAFHALDCDCAAQLSSTFKLIKRNKSGVVVYRYMEGRGIGLENKIKALELQRTHHLNTVDAFTFLWSLEACSLSPFVKLAVISLPASLKSFDSPDSSVLEPFAVATFTN